MSQAKQLFQDPDFRNQLNPAGKKGHGKRLKTYAAIFLGNKKKIRKLRRNCGVATIFILCLEVQHVVETRFPAISLGFFSGNMGAISDKHGERFHQNKSRMEKTYSGKWNPNILADYYWTLVREIPAEEYKRQKTTKLVSRGTFIHFY